MQVFLQTGLGFSGFSKKFVYVKAYEKDAPFINYLLPDEMKKNDNLANAFSNKLRIHELRYECK